MNAIDWNNYSKQYEDDTIKLLKICRDFLEKYFEHNQLQADYLMQLFLEKSKFEYDEDYIHHITPYSLAAIVHYLHHLNGDFKDTWMWVVDNEYNKPPMEAMAYYREHYFSS